MNRFNKIIKDIKTIKIQGATAIAKKGAEAFLLKLNHNSYKRLLNSRPTEPLLQNSLLFLSKSTNKKRDIKRFFLYIGKSNKKISIEGEKLIKNNMNIYSHCHSSTVISILKQAKKKGKHFVVYTSEVEPLLQGEKTAKELTKEKINIIVVPDLAIEQALSKCDLFLFGADAYLPKGVVNKIGTSLLCELARKHKIPAYSCGVSLKFAKKIRIEKRSGKELWDERNKFIKVENPAFDFTPSHLLTGVISEFGILKYKNFIEAAKMHLAKWG